MKQQLKEEGFDKIYLWEDKPNKTYKKHFHRSDTKIIITSGNMNITIANKSSNLKHEDKILIKANEKHEAIIGANGCSYIVAEREIK